LSVKGIVVVYEAKTGQAGNVPEAAGLKGQLEELLSALEMELVEFFVSRTGGKKKTSLQLRLVVCRAEGAGTGIDDCSRVHRAILPQLELAFPGQDISVEVSSPGIDRLIKDGAEFVHYLGRGVRCYRTDISDWSYGILESADKQGVVLKGKEGTMRLNYEEIAKAKLYPAVNAGCKEEG
jgi:ribosome maturation factor RimP